VNGVNDGFEVLSECDMLLSLRLSKRGWRGLSCIKNVIIMSKNGKGLKEVFFGGSVRETNQDRRQQVFGLSSDEQKFPSALCHHVPPVDALLLLRVF
jgi:hypothetical protein